MFHRLRWMARTVPWQNRPKTNVVALGRSKNRILVTVFWILLISPLVLAGEPASLKTLKFLQMGFSNQSEEMQKKLLRDMALLDSEDAIPFFIGIALDDHYPEDTRREALKGMIAVDSVKYRSILDTLQSGKLDEGQILRSIEQIGGPDLLSTILSSMTFHEEKKILDMKLSLIHRFWRDAIIDQFDFSTWPSQLAGKVLSEKLMSITHVDNRIRLLRLWSHLRDEASTKDIIKLLDRPNARVQEATLLALSSQGPSAVNAIGRFLQKSKDATLRKRAIFALRKIGGQNAKVALKSYLPQATPEEKKWIQEIVSN